MNADLRDRLTRELFYHLHVDPFEGDPDCEGLAAALLPVVQAYANERVVEALTGVADEADRFADDTYGSDIFHRPSHEDYAAINALLKRERGHQLDGIAADCMSRAIKLTATRIRDAARGGSDA